MSSTCLIVSNLPNRADRAFLHTLFEGNVKDSIWAGYGTGRFAIVSFKNAAYPARVLAVRKAYEEWKNDPTSGNKKPKKLRNFGKRGNNTASQTEDDDATDIKTDDMSVEELCATGESAAAGTTKSKSSHKNEEDDASAAAAASRPALGGVELDAFFGQIQSDFRYLYIAPSPISVEEILATGAVPGRTASGEADASTEVSRKTARQESAASGGNDKRYKAEPRASVQLPASSSAAAPAVEEPQAPSAAVADEAAGDETAAAAPRVRREREKKAKPPTRTVLADDDDDAPTASAPVASASSSSPVVVRQHEASQHAEAQRRPTATTTTAKQPIASSPPPPAAAAAPVVVAPSFARTSKDQCKFCGSELHLSRHCPNKK